jgi:hypothetical protein
MFKDPYEQNLKPQLGVGEHFVMLIFFLVVVCVGFLMFKAFVIEPIINPPAAQPEAKVEHK